MNKRPAYCAYSILWVVFMGLLTNCAPAPAVQGPHQPKFIVYYDDKLEAAAFDAYDVVVFDDVSHPTLETLRNRDRDILGYLSIGEVRGEEKAIIKKLDKAGALWGQHPYWKSYYVDTTNATWQNHLIDERVPAILDAGFNGIMIDTTDSALAQGDQRNINTYDELVNIICTIRQKHPSIKIMLNRGLDIVPAVGKCIDYVLAESIYINFDLASGVGTVYPQPALEQHVSFLQQVAQKQLGLVVFTLDYWNPKDVDGIVHIYKKQRDWGFIPYVATPDLKQFISEPLPLGKQSNDE